jgi:hypothetical protein
LGVRIPSGALRQGGTPVPGGPMPAPISALLVSEDAMAVGATNIAFS